jgi:hypothetical protein
LSGGEKTVWIGRVRTNLRVTALLIALVVTAFWFFSGPNLKWTKNSVTYKEKDPVTELEVDRYKKQFVPGIDFLGGGLGVAALIGVSSFLFRKKPAQPES